MIYRIIFLSTSLFFFLSCSSDSDCIEGNEVFRSESIIVGNYTAISNNGTLDVIISDNNDTLGLVEISGEDNLIELISTDIVDDVLELDIDGECISTNMSLAVTVSNTNLTTINNMGTGDITGTVETNQLDITNEGTGEIMLNGNTMSNLNITNEGTGDIFVDDIEVDNVQLENSGTGDIYVNVVTILSGSISGSGDVYYKGMPSLDVEILGSGELIDNN